MPTFQVNTAWAAMTEIIPNLYICGVSALNPSTILAFEFDLIVNCTKEVPNLNLPPDVDRLKLWLDDTEETDLLSSLHMAVDHMRMTLEVDGRVLVHCVAGISRSAAICLAYLVKYQSMSLREAYTHMAAKRARVRPNLGFWKQLIDFETEIRNESSVKINKMDGDQLELPDVYDGVNDEENGETKENENRLKDATNDPDCSSGKSDAETEKKIDDRKRHRQLSDDACGKRFIPKLEPVIENEQ